MKTSLKNFTKVLLGVAVLGAGAGAATANMKSNTKLTTMVGKYGTDDWRIINPSDEGTTWECRPTGEVCTSTLNPDATPNPDGSYNDSEVNIPSQSQNEHFVDLTNQ